MEDTSTSPMPMSDSDDDLITSPFHTMAARNPPRPCPSSARKPRRLSDQQRRSRSLRATASPLSTTLPNNSLPSAPASPPTPAPSPSPHRRQADWSTVEQDEEDLMRGYRNAFSEASSDRRARMLAEILNLCNSRDLTYIHDNVCPRLKRDPFATFPDEISLRVLSHVDHPRTLARASQVSRKWHGLVNDDAAWKTLCDKHAYRTSSEEMGNNARPHRSSTFAAPPHSPPLRPSLVPPQSSHPLLRLSSNSAPDLFASESLDGATSMKGSKRAANQVSYRTQFKRRYMVETAWRSGGDVHPHQITPEPGVVTSLHLTKKYIIVALDNAKIHVFDVHGGLLKTLHGHMMGVWATFVWDDTLVSGGCDRDVRVFDIASGQSVHTLRGHSSTVRCVRMSDANTAITGSRDTTLRIWDISKGRGFCKHVLVGHQASVRCLEVHGDLIASGSYDTTAKIWSISDGKCLRTLVGHFSQIYAIAFDGVKVATGSLDTAVRVWNAKDGQCLAVLSGHTSLVGQLQLGSNETLVTGGSDGSIRVWSMADYRTIHRLAAHDNSVTSLQFNESRIVSAGSDGRTKVWDLKTGALIRELGDPADSVWRVVFEEEKAIVLANRNQRTIMEVWSFSPRDETSSGLSLLNSPAISCNSSDVEMTDGRSTLPAKASPSRASRPAKPVLLGDVLPESNYQP